jgi:hypothetical protein
MGSGCRITNFQAGFRLPSCWSLARLGKCGQGGEKNMTGNRDEVSKVIPAHFQGINDREIELMTCMPQSLYSLNMITKVAGFKASESFSKREPRSQPTLNNSTLRFPYSPCPPSCQLLYLSLKMLLCHLVLFLT